MFLNLTNVQAGYGETQILWGVDLHINKGEMVSLIGSNGAGKTTLMYTIMGIIPLKGGEIWFEGERLDLLKPEEIPKKGIALVPQGRRLFAKSTVEQNLLIGAFTRNNKQEIHQDLEKIFTLFPRLYERRNQFAGTMSGGEQQMCAIARALMTRPKLMLIDEMSLGLAPLLVENILVSLGNLQQEGLTIMLVEQDVEIALEFSNRAYVMETGKILTSGPSKMMLDRKDIKEAYLGIG